jgi:hypothetical protein
VTEEDMRRAYLRDEPWEPAILRMRDALMTAPRVPAPREGMVWVDEPCPRWVAAEDVEDRAVVAPLIEAMLPSSPPVKPSLVMLLLTDGLVTVWPIAMAAVTSGLVVVLALLGLGRALGRGKA